MARNVLGDLPHSVTVPAVRNKQSTTCPINQLIAISQSLLWYRFRGVSKKKGKWEAKVMVNRKWAYRELFDSEEEAARAYDGAVWRLKPKEAKSYVNFKERPGQGSTKLAKAARAVERAQAKSVPAFAPVYKM